MKQEQQVLSINRRKITGVLWNTYT